MATAIPAAIAGLISQIEASPADLDVFDGPRPQGTSKKNYVTVGDEEEGGAAVEFTRSWAGIGGRRVDEEFTIACRLTVWAGGSNITALRTQAVADLDAVTAAVASDLTLGGAVRAAAVLGSGVMRHAQKQKGAVVYIDFGVHCEATINQS